MEVLKGVHALDTHSNTFVIAENRLVLIDTGVDLDAKMLLASMDKVKIRPRDLTSIVITHVHPDHVHGLARIKREAAGAKVVSSKVEAEYIAKKRTYDGPPGAATQNQPPTPVDVALDDGQAHDGLKVIFTPGHTRGSISLIDAAHALLIVGDAASNEGGLGPMDDQYNVDPRQHRESIKKLAALHFDNAVFGHGKPIVGGASAQFVALAKKL